ncbi:hypothetical protein CAI21_02575 [Alkalilimnicola ehrlichii]|uniref:Hydroxypyruvate reductase n=1 Tax=Alkalilimnicola ehrlichii TaxID=351052 RepID=A0A3E0X088_9GAMM|nr:DUF4147 domain-containing protein [Alkalilimnicola ehrlichii]RFA30884.1 hypothetical protein CAI21_02575 [Alkalilimnicola ehrlichii]RFA38834.1 hypothetical protein CAL65_02720 [Alkalilimnicola ehrlichii]
MSLSVSPDVLLDLYRAAVAAVGGRESVRAVLRADESNEPVSVIAIGKAASAMLAGAQDALGPRLRQALLITKHKHADKHSQRDARVTVIEAGHPWPDQTSLVAGQRLLAFLRGLSRPPLFLLSGGASSLVEVPVSGVGLAQLRALNTYLLSSGFDIRSINRVRQAVSQIKGGRLTHFLPPGRTQALLISDVPGDDPAIIGSGLLAAPLQGAMPSLPPELAAVCAHPAAPADPERLAAVDLRLVATNAYALDAIEARAARLGLPVRRHRRFVADEAVAGARIIANQLLAEPGYVHLWGGEPVVRLPAEPGRGGRMQSLALSAAQYLHGHAQAYLLAAGTDGTDGPGDAAGALVDNGTWERATTAGMMPAEALRRADAGTALAASGDLIRTGPTGTNVMDLMIGYCA